MYFVSFFLVLYLLLARKLKSAERRRVINAIWRLRRRARFGILEGEGLSSRMCEDRLSRGLRSGAAGGALPAAPGSGRRQPPGKRCSLAPRLGFVLQDVLEIALQNSVIFP